MILSMTGFGRGRALDSHKNRVEVELKSVNHKFFEMTPRLPSELSYLEGPITSYLRQKVSRGKFFLSVVYQRNSYEDLALNRPLAKRYHRLVQSLQRELGVSDPIRLDHLLTFPDIVFRKRESPGEMVQWNVVRRAVDQATASLLRTRREEGRVLEKDLRRRIRQVAALIERIAQQAPLCIQRYKETLIHRMKDFQETNGGSLLDPQQLEQEVALYAKNCDITEELVRLRSHLDHFRQSIAQRQEVGRKLDFIAQELQREANTIGSKTPDAKIARWVILAKSEIEKIREQVQNIE